ncbi:MAG: hypothetical protein FWC61_00680 [Proteobacteria bacterium]|nr:hypothetical protein [Pseudomonadota bacterium]
MNKKNHTNLLTATLGDSRLWPADHIDVLMKSISGIAPSKLGDDARYAFFKFFETVALPAVMDISPITLTGSHGIEHTHGVGRFSLDVSLSLDYNPVPALFAAALHDCARQHNAYDEEHGPNAVPVAKKLFAGKLGDWLGKAEQKSVIIAIRDHTIGMNAKNPISAALWDADRIRLSWSWGYEPEYFSTNEGRRIAGLPMAKWDSVLNVHNAMIKRLESERKSLR